jgi:hypothetical protein
VEQRWSASDANKRLLTWRLQDQLTSEGDFDQAEGADVDNAIEDLEEEYDEESQTATEVRQVSDGACGACSTVPDTLRD